jgi:hypothetical protein
MVLPVSDATKKAYRFFAQLVRRQTLYPTEVQARGE